MGLRLFEYGVEKEMAKISESRHETTGSISANLVVALPPVSFVRDLRTTHPNHIERCVSGSGTNNMLIEPASPEIRPSARTFYYHISAIRSKTMTL